MRTRRVPAGRSPSVRPRSRTVTHPPDAPIRLRAVFRIPSWKGLLHREIASSRRSSRRRWSLGAVARPRAHAALHHRRDRRRSVFRGPVGGNDEFIQLTNVSRDRVDISGWQLWGSNNAGTSRQRARHGAGRHTVLPAGKTFLFTNATPGTRLIRSSGRRDATYRARGVADNGGVQLRNAAATVIDAVGSNRRPLAGLPRGRRAQLPDGQRDQQRVHAQERRHAGHRRQRRGLPGPQRAARRELRHGVRGAAARCRRRGRDRADHEHPDAGRRLARATARR